MRSELAGGFDVSPLILSCSRRNCAQQLLVCALMAELCLASLGFAYLGARPGDVPDKSLFWPLLKLSRDC